jgi:hypothetical protein
MSIFAKDNMLGISDADHQNSRVPNTETQTRYKRFLRQRPIALVTSASRCPERALQIETLNRMEAGTV